MIYYKMKSKILFLCIIVYIEKSLQPHILTNFFQKNFVMFGLISLLRHTTFVVLSIQLMFSLLYLKLSLCGLFNQKFAVTTAKHKLELKSNLLVKLWYIKTCTHNSFWVTYFFIILLYMIFLVICYFYIIYIFWIYLFSIILNLNLNFVKIISKIIIQEFYPMKLELIYLVYVCV